MKYSSICAAVVAVIMMLTASGCGEDSKATAVVLGQENAKETVVVADPQSAVDEIYASLKEYEAVTLTDARVKDRLGIEESDLIEYYGKISNPRGGLADVVVLMPEESVLEDVQLALSKYKERRISEFENYDILDAYSIAQNAVIFSQGDYVIMLMLADNDSAREIIDKYIPF